MDDVEAPKDANFRKGTDGSLSLFVAGEGTARRTGAGQLVLHQDFSPFDHPQETAYSIVTLLENVGEGDGPTVVYEGSRLEEPAANSREQSLLAKGYRSKKLTGKRGDTFIFDAADWHKVEAIVTPHGMARRSGRDADRGEDVLSCTHNK